MTILDSEPIIQGLEVNGTFHSTHPINYVLKKSVRARHIRITVFRDGKVVVTAPLLTARFLIERFVSKKSSWIAKKVSEFAARPIIQNPLGIPKGNRRDFLKFKEQARALAHERLEFFNRHYTLEYKRISIKNQKTRWGSCSKRGNLSFNYRLVFLSPELRDYLIVHELCHLKEFNHSRKFWELVGEVILDYKKLSKTLRTGN